VYELEGVGETDVLGTDGLGAAGVADIVEWTSMVDICFERDEIAQPAKTPAAPVAEFTRPACPLPLAAEVVVMGPILADDSVCTVSGWLSAGSSGTHQGTYHILDHVGQSSHEHIHRLECLVPDQSAVSLDRSLKCSLLFVHHCKSHVRNNLPSQVIPIKDFDGSHHSHQTRYSSVDERIFQTPSECGYQDLFLGIRA
jgi:hypothetical protein